MALAVRQHGPGTLAFLSNLARLHGFDARWVHRQLQEYGGNAEEIASHMGVTARNAFYRFMERGAGRASTRGMHGGDQLIQGNFVDRALARGEKRKAEESLPNRPGPAQVEMNGEQQNMGGAPEEGGEQQVTKPTHIWRRFPNTETAALKWVMATMVDTYASGAAAPPYMPFDQDSEITTTSLQAGGGGAWANPANTGLTNNGHGCSYTTPQLIQLRMTSPYDIIKTYWGTDTSNVNAYSSQPVWLELFDNKYEYYHVLETEWEVTFNFGIPKDATAAGNLTNYQDAALYVFWKYTNEDDPPTTMTVGASTIANVGTTTGLKQTATVVTGGAGTYPLTPDDYFRMGGWHHKHVTFNTTHATTCKIQGRYKYGQCKMDIKTISSSDSHSLATTAEGWAKARAAPVFPENLSIIIVQDNARMTPAIAPIYPTGVRFETEQLIQFKDLLSNFKFPTPSNSVVPGTGAINTEAPFFWKGAGYT